MSILKKNYELSIWHDIEVAADGDTPSYFDERKDCIIGTDSMDFEGKAENPTFIQNINGTKTLSFSLPKRYYDEENRAFIDNYLVDRITNETKIKLKKDNKWYTFLVKEISERKSNKNITFSYSCTDLFINELSKIGWNKNFSNDIGNNNGTLTELATKVLTDTTWSLKANTFGGVETKEELVFKLSSAEQSLIVGTTITPINNGAKAAISSDDDVYLFYSDYNNINTLKKLQIVVLDNTEIFSKGDIIKRETENYEILSSAFFSEGQSILNSNPEWNYKANKVIRNPVIYWDNYEKRYVNSYKKENSDTIYYGYEKTYIVAPTIVKNLAINNINSFDGWRWDSTKLKDNLYASGTGESAVYGLEFKSVSSTLSASTQIYNDGIQSNKYELIGGKPYIFKVKYNSEENKKPTFTIKMKGSIESISSIESDTYYCIIPDKTDRNGQICLTIPSGESSFIITDIQFFEGYTTDNSNIPSGELSSNIISKMYNLDSENLLNLTATYSTKLYLFDSYEIELSEREYYTDDNNFQAIYLDSNEKTRNFEASQSNCFSLIQNLGELFNCWASYEIEYEENGKIKLDDITKKQKKEVTFREQVEITNNNVGFTYGVNLFETKRNLVSSEITTKLYVEPCDNEYSDSGVCSIELSKNNISKEKFLINFDYYIQKGMVNYDTLVKDLYGTTSDDLGYLYNLGLKNKEYDKIVSQRIALQTSISSLENQLVVLDAGVKEVNIEINKLTSNIAKYQAESAEKEKDQANLDRDKAKLETLKTHIINIAGQSYLDNQVIDEDSPLGKSKAENEEIIAQEESIINDKKDLDKQFMDKYSRFIQEGVWSSDNYVNNDLYYLDSELTLSQSSKPKVSYELGVIDIGVLEGYDFYNYSVGDLTYIEDTEFFGYNVSSKTPYREVVIVSEIEENLDSPMNNKITIQNFNSQFEDLFQRITNATQTLEFNKNYYNRAATNFTANKQLDTTTIQNSLLNNNLILSASKDQTVVIDNNGIEVSDLQNMYSKLRIVAAGILLSKDGGLTWDNAIKGTGINANFITAGQIDVNKIAIMSGNQNSFTWTSRGINAFGIALDENSEFIVTDKFVRMDPYGFYAAKGIESSDFETNLYNKTTTDDRINYIKDNADISFTWDGFNLKTSNGSVNISSTDDIQVLDEDKNQIIKIGNFSDSNTYGIKITTSEGAESFVADNLGNLKVSGEINALSGAITGYLAIGDVTSENYKGTFIDGRPTSDILLKIGNNFTVDTDGNLSATNGVFNGLINAVAGQFSGKVTIGPQEIETTVEGEEPTYSENTSFITGDLDSPVIMQVGSNFSITPLGQLHANDVILEGAINASRGTISGLLKIGNNEDIYINGSSEESGNPIIIRAKEFTLDKDGKINAKNIVLGSGAVIEEYLKFDDETYIYAPSISEDDYFIKTKATTLDYQGKLSTSDIDIENGLISDSLYVGSDQSGIIISGLDTPYIQSSNYQDSIFSNGWKISNDGSAVFNNVSVRGEINSSIFKYNEIQTLSGQLFIANSDKILSISEVEDVENTYLISTNNLDKIGYFFIKTSDEKFYLYSEDGINYSIKGTDSEIDSFNDLVTNGRINGEVIIYLGEENKDNLLISLNSTSSNLVSTPRAINVTEFLNWDDDNNTISQKTRMIIGALPSSSTIPELETFSNLYEPNSFGLYCDNVLLNGALISSYKDSDDNLISSGMNTKNTENSLPILWAGAVNGDLESSSFKVYRDGSVSAAKGTFQGTVIADELIIKNGWLKGDSGLYLSGASAGIKFYGNSLENETMAISSSGVHLKDGADLEIYDADNNRYLYSNDSKQNLNLCNIRTYSLLEDEDATIEIDEKQILFKNNEGLSSEITNEEDALLLKKGSSVFSLNDTSFSMNNNLNLNTATVNNKMLIGEKIMIEAVANGYDLIVLD